MERRTHHRTGIYKVTNIVTGDFYIGASASVYYRISNHIWTFKNGRCGNSKMRNDALIYGYQSFIYETLEFCDPIDRDNREQYFIDLLKPTYNKWMSVKIPKGYKHSEESIVKMTKNNPGIKDKAAFSEKLKAAWFRHRQDGTYVSRMKNIDQTGYKHSEETKVKMSEALKECWKNPDIKKNMLECRKYKTGFKHSDETRLKISNAKKGKILSEETREKMRQSHAKRLNYKLKE